MSCLVGICELSLQELMSQTHVLKSLCLRGTYLVDQALYNFKGSSLEMLDVSNTKVCCHIHEVWHVFLYLYNAYRRF